MDAALQAIAEPRRRAILELIREGELTAGAIAERFEVTRPAISQHLRILADAGLVTVRAEGTRRYYLARPEGLHDIREYLDRFWDERLLALRRAAELEQRRTDAARNARPIGNRSDAPRSDAQRSDAQTAEPNDAERHR